MADLKLVIALMSLLQVVCNARHSSVLFDGIPTLAGLEGDMWVSQLLTLNTSTSSASITFDFTNSSDRNETASLLEYQLLKK